MTSQSKSKAERRAESQRRAEEKRAAELRKKRARVGLRVGGAVVVIAVIVVIVTQLTGSGGTGPVPPQLKDPHVAGLAPIPASMKADWVQPPAGTPGPETIPVPSGPKLATLLTTATGRRSTACSARRASSPWCTCTPTSRSS